MLMLLDTCDNCEAEEERVFTDTWTGKSLCLACLVPIVEDVTNAPSCGDNLDQLLRERANNE